METIQSAKTGLVMEGGALRGIYTAGVTDVFLENGITFDAAVGVSAGACFGCNIMSKQVGRALRYNLKYCNDPRYCGMISLLTTGDIFNADFCYREIVEVLDPLDTKTWKQNPMKFYVVCTDVKTGKPVYQRVKTGEEKDVLWIRASASMPMVSRVVDIDGRGYLDGGISDSIPVGWMRSQGYERTVVILTQPEGYHKHPSRMLPAVRLALHRYPAVADAMARRHIMYNRELAEISHLERTGEVFVIRPSRKVEISRTETNPHRIQEQYDLGRADALAKLEQLKAFLNG